jgi:hypothetical protein
VASVVYTNPETGYRAWDVPSWCNDLVLSIPAHLSAAAGGACAPPTPDQIAETTMSNMGGAAASNPAVAQQVQAIANLPPTDPYYCQADPEGCAAYASYQSNPTCSTIFGVGTSGQFLCGTPLGFSNVWLIAGAAVILLFLVRR